jgi:uncharacterized membrane protein YphA (DoxX/SURF4 family)
MDDGAATLEGGLSDGQSFDFPFWKATLSTIAALVLALLFLASGAWKLTDPFAWAQVLGQFRVPSALAMPFTLTLGVVETLGGVLIILPRFRRWGAILIGLTLIAFMLYVGANYGALVGKECSCFPLVKRSIGPGFFVGDFAMLLMALIAGLWVRPPSGMRAAWVILAALSVFAGMSYGINAARQTGLKAPDTVTVDGKPYSLAQGQIFLFFYDPECMHCDAAARRMAKLNWGDTNVVAIPTRMPQFAAAFLHDTGLRAVTTLDVKPLRDVFKFVDPPYGVALKNGRQTAVVAKFEDFEPEKTLRSIHFLP